MKKIVLIALTMSCVFMTSCNKDFLERPSQNNPTEENYYNNAEQVNSATGLLYNRVWYDYQDKAFHAIGEALGGNMLTANDPNYGGLVYNKFTFTSSDVLVAASWASLYSVVGSASSLVQTLENKRAAVSDDAYLVQGIAEARFMRGVAFFFLARAFGNVPIIDDPVAFASSGVFDSPRYLQKDVLRYVLEDLQYAEDNLASEASQKGRITNLSATGLMAKVYLYMGDYANAKAKAAEVINSGKYDLYPDYNAMFTSSAANNNQESLFAWQWIAEGGYSYGNPIQAYCGTQALLKPTTGAGWGSVIPTIDLIKSYETGDKRRGWSLMEHGFVRADWTNKNFPNGYRYDTTSIGGDEDFKTKNTSRANALKYVVGPGTNGENVNGTSTDICTYILRYADILLIYAEATLGENASTSDATALDAFNKVRKRAGLIALTSLTKDIILHERRVELAFEGDYWFDIQRQGFEKAKAIIAQQERGGYDFSGTHKINSEKVVLTSAAQLFLPIPQTDLTASPKLSEEPVPYY
ncbi:RagB/SusD family nutrient uptake outer membrane protein [Cytophagaceae bacterium DM2B3-1]|uniref:RagB/SusD family nutrient uptake outer membrane protein n=1 Tax=Xanthocytophaga flava TaxID=3048013 RepID=A0ABT7CY68_9BACT|nr:RagB/SusD family nutrient uptake outer membrane protein [Xanthocytophaga flavus]MDJ1498670.1 RagB/SusD family nutrient uptake outer membrane protein [Xanthocytophaga flavus]